MNVKKLSKFRAKLVKAKEFCAFRGFSEKITLPFMDAGLRYKCANVLFDCIMPNDVFEWYANPCRTVAERKAMWDNSIAAIDVRIAKGKK